MKQSEVNRQRENSLYRVVLMKEFDKKNIYYYAVIENKETLSCIYGKIFNFLFFSRLGPKQECAFISALYEYRCFLAFAGLEE